MRKRATQIELPGLPLMPMKLKDIPLENGDGAPLGRCIQCDGDGEICSASKEHETPSGSKTTETTRIRKAQVKKHTRGLWKVHCEPCKRCNGAGMVKVGGPNA